MTTSLTRRSFFAVGATVTALGVAACGSSSKSTSSASAPPTGEGVYARTADGFHLNSKIEAPTVTLYSDFQCPYCAKAESTYMEVAKELNGVMNVTVKNFPLLMHTNAVPSALAVEAAEAQGKHVEMAHKIFATQADWKNLEFAEARKIFDGYAKELGLDTEKFSASFDSEDTLAVIENDYNAGRAAGVSGTPQWVVGGRVIEEVESSTTKEDMVAAFKKAAGI